MKRLWLNNKIPILVYHRVVPVPLPESRHKIWVDAQNFKRQMNFLASRGFNTISLDILVSAFKGICPLPEKPIILTFDDGYKDNYLYAFPILKEYNFTATIFLVSKYIGDTNQWDRISQEETVHSPHSIVHSIEEPINLLSIDEIREMVEYGITFGAHTVTHPHLQQLSEKKAFHEINQSKIKIEKIIGHEITSFCYPYGEVNPTIKQMVIEAGFDCACACDTEQINDLYELSRRQVFPKTGMFGFWKKTQKWYHGYTRLKRLRR